MLELARQQQVASVPVNSYVLYRDAANPRGWNAGLVLKDMVQANQTIEVAPLRFSGTTESLLEAFRDAPKKPWAHFHNSIHNYAVEGGKPPARRGSANASSMHGTGHQAHRQSVVAGGAAPTVDGGAGRHRKSVAASGAGKRRNRAGGPQAAVEGGQSQEPQGGKGNFIDEVDVGLCPASVLRQTQILEALKRHALPLPGSGASRENGGDGPSDGGSALPHSFVKAAVSRPVSYFQTLPDVLIFESAHQRSAASPLVAPMPPPAQNRVVGFADEDGTTSSVNEPQRPPPPTRLRLNVFRTVLLVQVPATELKVVLGLTSGQAAAPQQQRASTQRANYRGSVRHVSIASSSARGSVSPTDSGPTPTRVDDDMPSTLFPQPPDASKPIRSGGAQRSRQRSVFNVRQELVSPVDDSDSTAGGSARQTKHRTPSTTPSTIPPESHRKGPRIDESTLGVRDDLSLEVEPAPRSVGMNKPRGSDASTLLDIVQGTALDNEVPGGAVVGAGRGQRARRSVRMDASTISPGGAAPRVSPGATRSASYQAPGPNQPVAVLDYVAFDRSILEVLPALLHTQQVAEEAEALAAQLLEPIPRYHALLKCLTIPRLNSHWLNYCRGEIDSMDLSNSTLLVDHVRPGMSPAAPSDLPPPHRVATVLASFFPADVSDDMMQEFATTIATHWNAMSRLSFSMVQHPFLSPTAMELSFELKRPVKQPDAKGAVELEKREKQDHLVAEDAIPSISKKGIAYVMSAIAFRLSKSPDKPMPPQPWPSTATSAIRKSPTGSGAPGLPSPSSLVDGAFTPRRVQNALVASPPAALTASILSPASSSMGSGGGGGDDGAAMCASGINNERTPRDNDVAAMTPTRLVTFDTSPAARPLHRRQMAEMEGCLTSPNTVALTLPLAATYTVVPLQHIELCFLKLEDADLMGRGDGSLFFAGMRQALPWLATLSLRGNFLTDASLIGLVNLWTEDVEERVRRDRTLRTTAQRRRSRRASARFSVSGMMWTSTTGHTPTAAPGIAPPRGAGSPAESAVDDAGGGGSDPPRDVVAIRRLDLSLNRIGDAGAFALSNALENGCVAPLLSLVNLEGNAISKEIKDNVLAGLFVPQLAPAWTMQRHLRCERSVRRRVMVLAYALLAMRDRRSVLAAASMSFSISHNDSTAISGTTTATPGDPFSIDTALGRSPATGTVQVGDRGASSNSRESMSLGRVSIPFLTYSFDPSSKRRGNKKRMSYADVATAGDATDRRASMPFSGDGDGISPGDGGNGDGSDVRRQSSSTVEQVPSPRTRKSIVSITVDVSSHQNQQRDQEQADAAGGGGYSSSDCDDNGVPLLLSPSNAHNKAAAAAFPAVAIFRRMSHRELSSVARLHRDRMVETERRRDLQEQESLVASVAQWMTMYERTQPLTVLF